MVFEGMVPLFRTPSGGAGVSKGTTWAKASFCFFFQARLLGVVGSTARPP